MQVKLMACKFLDANGDGYTSDAIKCLSYALQVGGIGLHVTRFEMIYFDGLLHKNQLLQLI